MRDARSARAVMIVIHSSFIFGASLLSRQNAWNKHRSKDQLEDKLYLTHRRARTADGAEAIGSIGAVRIPPSEEVVIGHRKCFVGRSREGLEPSFHLERRCIKKRIASHREIDLVS